jgi:hypothetical protein
MGPRVPYLIINAEQVLFVVLLYMQVTVDKAVHDQQDAPKYGDKK